MTQLKSIKLEYAGERSGAAISMALQTYAALAHQHVDRPRTLPAFNESWVDEAYRLSSHVSAYCSQQRLLQAGLAQLDEKNLRDCLARPAPQASGSVVPSLLGVSAEEIPF